MTHSILLARRNRRNQLKMFLESLDLPDGFDLVITDLASTDGADLIKKHSERLRIKHLRIEYRDEFYKTKALNHALLNTDSEWVTMVDLDCIFPRAFFAGVSSYLESHPDLPRLSYRIYRHQTAEHRRIFIDPNPDWYAEFEAKIINRPERWPCRAAYETHGGFLTGNSHLTIRKADLLSVGAWNEEYIGYGFEDHDLNMRLWRVYGDTTIYPVPLHQQVHGYERDWDSEEARWRNGDLFEAEKANGFPSIKLPKDFGIFGGTK